MAQSKKDVLKRIDRGCAHLHPHVRSMAARLRSDALLDTFERVWGEAYSLLREQRRGYAGTLEHPKHKPVTSQQAQQLYERWQALSQQVLSSL